MTDGGDDPTAGDGEPADGASEAAPLSDLAASVGERRDRTAPDLFDEVFPDGTLEEPAEGTIWDSDEGSGGSEFGAVGEVVEEGERTYVVSKRNFCERCRHFSEPPEVRCTNDGTRIREFVDMDHVRLHSCPIVEERGLPDDPPIG